eukprot:15914871-Heterocapsa_arctica.AAC.1
MVAEVRQDVVHVADQVLQHAPLQPSPSLAKVNVLALSSSQAEVDVHAPDLHVADQLLHLPLLLLVASPFNSSILAPLVITEALAPRTSTHLSPRE